MNLLVAKFPIVEDARLPAFPDHVEFGFAHALNLGVIIEKSYPIRMIKPIACCSPGLFEHLLVSLNHARDLNGPS